MKQGTLSFQYEEEKRTGGTTGLGGLGVYVEMAQAMGLRGWVERHVGVRAGGQGWRDSEVVMALVLLNLAGGESVGDVEVLEKDEGFCRILRQAEGYGKGRREGRGEERGGDGGGGVGVGCHQRRRCFVIWRDSTRRERVARGIGTKVPYRKHPRTVHY